jgi:hypothetical protein
VAETLTIRPDAEDRVMLGELARKQGRGVSSLIRDLAAAEVRRARRDAIRSNGESVVAYLARHVESTAEIDELGTPPTDLS